MDNDKKKEDQGTEAKGEGKALVFNKISAKLRAGIRAGGTTRVYTTFCHPPPPPPDGGDGGKLPVVKI